MLDKMRDHFLQRLQNCNFLGSNATFFFDAQLLFIVFRLQLQPEGSVLKNIAQLLRKSDRDAFLPINDGTDMLFGYAGSLRQLAAMHACFFQFLIQDAAGMRHIHQLLLFNHRAQRTDCQSILYRNGKHDL